MKKMTLLSSLLGFLMAGCLYVAPIEEEENALPAINTDAVSPSLGVVELELNDDAVMKMILSAFDDENEDQALYHRVIIDLRPAGEYRIIATEPRVIEPGNRDRIMYQIRPCSMLSGYGNVIQDGKSIDVYFVLADERFMSDSEIIISKEGEFQQPFKTNPENRTVWVQWSLAFKGSCPDG